MTLPAAPIDNVTRLDAATPFTFTAPLKDPNSVEQHGRHRSGWLADGDALNTVDVFADLAELTIDQEDDALGIVSGRCRAARTDRTTSSPAA